MLGKALSLLRRGGLCPAAGGAAGTRSSECGGSGAGGLTRQLVPAQMCQQMPSGIEVSAEFGKCSLRMEI